MYVLKHFNDIKHLTVQRAKIHELVLFNNIFFQALSFWFFLVEGYLLPFIFKLILK